MLLLGINPEHFLTSDYRVAQGGSNMLQNMQLWCHTTINKMFSNLHLFCYDLMFSLCRHKFTMGNKLKDENTLGYEWHILNLQWCKLTLKGVVFSLLFLVYDVMTLG